MPSLTGNKSMRMFSQTRAIIAHDTSVLIGEELDLRGCTCVEDACIGFYAVTVEPG